MATHRRPSVALAASLTVGALLVVLELLTRSSWLSDARTPSSLVSEVVGSLVDVEIGGWAALLVPVVLVLLLGLLIDAMSGTRR